MPTLPRAPRAILFDHDGTLVDSPPVVIAATRSVMTAHGVPASTMTDAAIVLDMAYHTAERMGRACRTTDAATCQRLAQAFYDAAIEHAGAAAPYPGIADLCARLTRAGRRLAVVSNNEARFCRRVLTLNTLSQHFTVILGEEVLPAPKPDRRAADQALAGLGLSANDAVMIGDGPADVGLARNAGIASIGVTWGALPEADLKRLGFDAVAHDVAELAALLGV